MKKLAFALCILFSLASFSLTNYSCKSKDSATKNMEDKSGPEYTSAYVCPMHCEGSGSDAPGKCPKCGMDYVKNKELDDHSGHNHDGHDHSGHDHNHDH